MQGFMHFGSGLECTIILVRKSPKLSCFKLWDPDNVGFHALWVRPILVRKSPKLSCFKLRLYLLKKKNYWHNELSSLLTSLVFLCSDVV